METERTQKMSKLTIKDLDLRGKRVFMRVDFNVPLKDGVVTDDTRIRETLPTLKLAIEKGGRLLLASHLGRPKGGPDPKYSLQPAAKKLEELLGRPVAFALDCVGPGAEGQSKALRDGETLVLENVRFHPEEEKNDEAFSKQLAALCDGIFICDAFGSAHRAHASVVGITRFVKQAAAGLLMEKELAYLGKAVTNPARPFVAILGGAKVSDKIEVVENLMKIADAMLIGGGMAYTFLKAEGQPMGKSLAEDAKLDLANLLRAEPQQKKFALLLPVDHVVGAEFKPDAATKTVSVSATPDGWMGLDIGPKTIDTYRQKIASAKTIVWNGPMGVFEMPAFAKGTLEVAKAVAAPFTAISTAVDAAKGSNVAIAGQNVSWSKEGAFTGEVSAPMLAEAGCRYVVIGHSERRQLFRETDDNVAKKTLMALESGLTPIVCLGETQEERDAGLAEAMLSRQFNGGPGALTSDEFSRILIAYEPVWAIGTGRTATPEIAAEAHSFLRRCAGEKFSVRLASALRILYGGSVKPDNIQGLMVQEELDGALVGGASLDPKSFAAIVNFS